MAIQFSTNIIKISFALVKIKFIEIIIGVMCISCVFVAILSTPQAYSIGSTNWNADYAYLVNRARAIFICLCIFHGVVVTYLRSKILSAHAQQGNGCLHTPWWTAIFCQYIKKRVPVFMLFSFRSFYSYLLVIVIFSELKLKSWEVILYDIHDFKGLNSKTHIYLSTLSLQTVFISHKISI